MKGKFVIVAKMPGCEMFISSTKADVTDKKADALEFDYEFDNPLIKQDAYRSMTGIDNWQAQAI